MVKRVVSMILTAVMIFTVASVVGAKELKDENGRKKVLMVIAAKDFEDREFFAPKAILEENGAKITVASTTTDNAYGYHGGVYKPDLLLSDVKVKKYDAVLVIGGYGIMNEWDNQDLRKLVIEANNENKILSAICAAPVVLARAGVLRGREATCFPWEGIYNELINNGASYVDEETVVSGNIVTGRNVDASEAYGRKLCEVLGILDSGRK